MNGRVLANAGVFALGIILIIGGGWAISRGSGYVQLEWGWTSVIAGSIAATGGVLTLAIGFVLQRLDAVQGALLRAGANADAMAPTGAMLAAEEAANDPPPLGIAPPAPVAHAPEPQAAAHPDPALQAAAAINLELLAHEERPAAPGHHPEDAQSGPREISGTAASEPPPEVIHAADQGPADDMVKAAGVSDEPELDAALEELLAEERGGGSAKSPAVELPFALPAGQERKASPAPLPVDPEAERTPQRSGWRGLFSRKERRTAPPAAPEEQPAFDVSPDGEEQQLAPAPEEHPVAEHAPAVHPDAIPRTGDDWFDRALSGLDEVAEPHARPGRSRAPQTDQGTDKTPDHEAPISAGEEEPSGGAPHPEPAVMGRYTSGNTTYIMFADGSIEAETPNGILHFASLADLKVYVEGQ